MTADADDALFHPETCPVQTRGNESLRRYAVRDRIEIGLDETGRGSLFGPVVVGAVILPHDEEDYRGLSYKLTDSKRVDERKRLILRDEIMEMAVEYHVARATPAEIDEKNILHATMSCMQEVVQAFALPPEALLVDGSYFPGCTYQGDFVPYTCVEQGDSKYTAIAAASILAKTERDHYMKLWADLEPELDEFYGIRQNKGYGQLEHMRGLEVHGPTEFHRFSYEPVRMAAEHWPVRTGYRLPDHPFSTTSII